MCLFPHLVLITVFNNLCTQVTAGYCSQVLLVALAITRIFVQHVRRPRLDLWAYDVVPQLPCWNDPSTAAFSLVSTRSPHTQWSMLTAVTSWTHYIHSSHTHRVADSICPTFSASWSYVCIVMTLCSSLLISQMKLLFSISLNHYTSITSMRLVSITSHMTTHHWQEHTTWSYLPGSLSSHQTFPPLRKRSTT